MRNKKHNDRGVESRWTPALAKHGFAAVSETFLAHHAKLKPYPITAGEAYLIVQILSFKWDEKWPFPALTKIAGRMGRSERYISKLCKNLEGKGYLVRREREGRRTKELDLSGLFDALEKHLERLERAAGVLPMPQRRLTKRAAGA